MFRKMLSAIRSMLNETKSKILFYWHLISEGVRKILFAPLIEFFYIFFGSTFAIYFSWIVIRISQHFSPKLAWPGFIFFFNNGSILLISFSFLASSAYLSTRSLKINFWNAVTVILIVVNALVYSEYLHNIPLSDSYKGSDPFLYWYSFWVFFLSSIWLFIILIMEQIKSVDLNEIRKYSLRILEQKFKPKS